MIEAKVIEHSTSEANVELITLQLRYPRFVHAEFMTHRVFSRNASSSRAIPVAKMLEQVRNEPAMPIHWGMNQPGMQAREEVADKEGAIALWLEAADKVAWIAGQMNKLGLHKQVANRILEPFQYISVIVTATEWDNFFELRDHPDADPNIAELARVMRAAIRESTAVWRHSEVPGSDHWHLPYITEEERRNIGPLTLAKISAARCARVSYLTHDGKRPEYEKDLALYAKLIESKPMHASPIEHQAFPMKSPESWSKNFRGWKQFREVVESW